MKRAPAAGVGSSVHRGRFRWYVVAFAFFIAINLVVVLLFETHPHGVPQTFVRSPNKGGARAVAPGGVAGQPVAVASGKGLSRIPRTIHMTWKTADVPFWAQNNVDTWRRLNPGYEWVLHTDAEMDAYVRTRHPDVVEPVWDKLKPIQKADFYRYIVVLDEGGVYADLDVTCVEPVDHWAVSAREFGTDVGLVAGFEAVVDQKALDNHWFARKFQVAQWVFAGAPGHPVLRNVVEMIVAKLGPMTVEEVQTASVIRTTGPAIWSDAVTRYLQEGFGVVLGEQHPLYGGALLKERVQGHASHIGDVLLLPEVAFGSRDSSPAGGQMVVHNFQGTWKAGSSNKNNNYQAPSQNQWDGGGGGGGGGLNPAMANYQAGFGHGTPVHERAPFCSARWLGAQVCIPQGVQSPYGEEVVNLLDDSPQTKWLAFLTKPPAQGDADSDDLDALRGNHSWLETAPSVVWVQLDFRDAWRAAYGDADNAAPPRVCSYSLTSADDMPRRDPWAWRLMGHRRAAGGGGGGGDDGDDGGTLYSFGSGDSGADDSGDDGEDVWEILDARAGEEFDARLQRREFQAVGCPSGGCPAYDVFRLEVLRLQNPRKADGFQLGDVDLLGCPDTNNDNDGDSGRGVAASSSLPTFLRPSLSLVNPRTARAPGPPQFTEQDLAGVVSSSSPPSSVVVPRVLHQSWKGSQLPARFEAFVSSWLRLNPGWAYVLWTDADCDAFMEAYFPSYLDMFRGYATGIQRADAFRYFVLFAYGGVYVDLDMEALSPLDAYLAQFVPGGDSGATGGNSGSASGSGGGGGGGGGGGALGAGSYSGVILSAEPAAHAKVLYNKARLACNAAMLSVPGHPFWARAVFPELLERKGIRTVRATGPKMLEAAVQRYEGVAPTGDANEDSDGGTVAVKAAKRAAEVAKAAPVAFAEPSAFFPTFDALNQELRNCCDEGNEYAAAHCGVGGAGGRAAVAGRAETCAELRSNGFSNPPGKDKYARSVAKHHWAHTWFGQDAAAAVVHISTVVQNAKAAAAKAVVDNDGGGGGGGNSDGR